MMDYEEYLLAHQEDINSESFGKFAAKIHLHLDAKVAHIAGSNGKGEVAFYLHKIASFALKEKCGVLFNSYFLHPSEAIWIGDQPLAEEKIASYFEAWKPFIEKYEPTCYELLVCMAYTAWNEAGVELAIVECGMGGAYDPSNAIPLNGVVSCLTNVSLEHTEYLGTTLSEIALNKAGIIEENVPVLFGRIDEESLEALRALCAKKKAPILRLERVYLPHLVAGKEFHFDYPPYKDLIVEGIASYHVTNACMAIELAKAIPSLQGMAEEEMREALRHGELPGRLERKGDVYLDSASNPDAAETLRRTFPTVGHGKRVHVLYAARTDTNISIMIPLLADEAATLTLTTFDALWARSGESFALYTEDHEFIENPLMAIMTLEMRYPGESIVCTGCPEFIAYLKARL